MRLRFLCSIFILLLFIGCSNDDSEPFADPNISRVSLNYLNGIIDVMETNSINRGNINWSDFRASVFEIAGPAQTIEETYPAILKALELLEDNHSFLRTAEGEILFAGGQCPPTLGSISFDEEDIGYIYVGSFGGTSGEARTYANAIVDEIKRQDKADLKGWIVDIRDNGGGNMFPMLGAVGPILGEGSLGYFEYPNGRQSEEWTYSNGEAKNDNRIRFQLLNPYTLLGDESPKVAVLTNRATGSSGEAIAIAFRGRPDTKSFGTATCGRPTANVGYPLSNNSTLVLTVGFMVDRNRNVYDEPIVPDEIITDNDLMLEAAKDWLRIL